MPCKEDTPRTSGQATMDQRRRKVCERGILEDLGALRNLSPALEARLMAMSKVPQS